MIWNDEIIILLETLSIDIEDAVEKLIRMWEELVAPLAELFEQREIEFPEEEKIIIGIDLALEESQTAIMWAPIPRKKPPDSVCQSAH